MPLTKDARCATIYDEYNNASFFSGIGGQSHTVYECRFRSTRAIAIDETTPFTGGEPIFMAQILVDECIEEQKQMNRLREEEPCPDDCLLNELANRTRWYTSGSKGERK